MAKKMDKEKYKDKLTTEQYDVLCNAGTEKPFTGKYVDKKDDGTYECAACGQPLFSTDTQFHSGTGWPSFYDVINEGNVELQSDTSLGDRRVEVICKKCGGHLGHLFNDGPQPTGKRFCINSAALNLKKDE